LLSWIALAVVYLMWGTDLPGDPRRGRPPAAPGSRGHPVRHRRHAAVPGRPAGGEQSRGPGEGRARPGAKAWLAGAVVGILHRSRSASRPAHAASGL